MAQEARSEPIDADRRELYNRREVLEALLIYTASTRKLASEDPRFVGSKPIAQCDLKTRLRRHRPGYTVFPATHQNYKAGVPWNLPINVRPRKQQGARVKRLGVVMLAFAPIACGFVPERVCVDDPRVVELMVAARAIDRAALGFSPIDRTAEFRLESCPRAGYDAMLHVDGRTNRTIAFRRGATSYELIGEQETFEGPAEYDTVDGRFHEAVTITFEKVPLSGVPLNSIDIHYRGDDHRLLDLDLRDQLSLHEVRPVLVKWGYRE